MKISWTACIAAGLQAVASAAIAEPAATPTKVINKDAAKPADASATPPAADGKVTVKAEVKETPKPAAAAKAHTPAPAEDAPKAAAKAEAKVETTAKPVDGGKDDAAEKTIAKTVAPPPKPKPAVVISVDLTRQRMTVAEDGVEKYHWPISSGRAGYYTPTGNFRPQWMAKMWRSRKYDDAPMPNSIFFTGGFAIHATFATGMLGRPASHGCVRLAPANAAALFKMVQARGMDRTKITVFGAPRQSEPQVARREESRPRYGAPGLGPQRYAYGYRQPSNSQPQQRYVVAPQPPKKNLFVSIFGSNQPQAVAVQPRQRHQGQQRPLYVYTQDGRLVRVR